MMAIMSKVIDHSQSISAVDVVPRAPRTNVGGSERQLSLLAGAAVAAVGLVRRDLPGVVVSAIGVGMIYRGITGNCSLYRALGVNTAVTSKKSMENSSAITVVKSFLVDRSQEDLYGFWRNFENLPAVMSHLQSVSVLDDRHSRWRVDAPTIVGGSVTWDAEVVDDRPNERISWRSLSGSAVENEGSVEFRRAPGDRGTAIRVVLRYSPPAGSLGNLITKIFGSNPESQVREDLRNFKRAMEVGDVLTTDGQPRGACLGGIGRLMH